MSASPMTLSENDKALIRAIRLEKMDRIRDLLSQGVNFDLKDDNGWTLMHHAVEADSLEIVQHLLEVEKGKPSKMSAAVDNKQRTPLDYAITYAKKSEIVSALVDHYSTQELNKQNNKGETALHLTVKEVNRKAFPKILAKGVDVNAVNIKGCTALHYTARYDERGMLRSLLAVGANIDMRDQNGCTPLHVAASKLNVEIVEELLLRGANFWAKTSDGETAEELIVSKKNTISSLRNLESGFLGTYEKLNYKFSKCLFAVRKAQSLLLEQLGQDANLLSPNEVQFLLKSAQKAASSRSNEEGGSLAKKTVVSSSNKTMNCSYALWGKKHHSCPTIIIDHNHKLVIQRFK